MVDFFTAKARRSEEKAPQALKIIRPRKHENTKFSFFRAFVFSWLKKLLRASRAFPFFATSRLRGEKNLKERHHG